MHAEHAHVSRYLHSVSPCLQTSVQSFLNPSLLLHLGFLGKIKCKHLKHMNLLYSLHQLCLAWGFIVKHCVFGSLFSEEGIRSPEARVTGCLSSWTRVLGPKPWFSPRAAGTVNHWAIPSASCSALCVLSQMCPSTDRGWTPRRNSACYLISATSDIFFWHFLIGGTIYPIAICRRTAVHRLSCLSWACMFSISLCRNYTSLC